MRSFSKKNIFLLLLGRTCSKFASSFYLIVLPLYILNRTGGDTARVGIFFFTASIPAVLCTPFLGIIVERVNRKYSIIFCDLITSFFYFILWFTSTIGEGSLIVLLAVSICINLLSNTFEISSKVLFTELTTPDTIEKYNGIKSFCDNCAMVIAPALGTFVYGLWGFESILFIVMTAYFLSAIQETFIKYKNIKIESKERGAVKIKWFSQMSDIFTYIYENKDLFALFILMMSLNFFIASDNEIIFPGILINKYKISESLYGLSQSSLIMGTLAAGLFVFLNKKINLRRKFKRLIITNSVFMIMIGIFSIVCYPHKSVYYVIFICLLFIIGFTTTCVNIPLGSYFQTRVPLAYQGRFFALVAFFAELLIPLGIAFAGLVVSKIQADVTFIIFNAILILIVLLAMSKKSIITQIFQE